VHLDKSVVYENKFFEGVYVCLWLKGLKVKAAQIVLQHEETDKYFPHLPLGIITPKTFFLLGLKRSKSGFHQTE
jgi:hypothetical protein